MNEQQLEALCLTWFQETGWQFVHGPAIASDGERPERTDYRQVLLRERLLTAWARINPHIPVAALEQAAHVLQTVSEPQLALRNRAVHRLLLSGVSVEFSDGERKKTDLVRRTLQRWKYPPTRQPEAVELVLKQAESLSDEWSR